MIISLFNSHASEKIITHADSIQTTFNFLDFKKELEKKENRALPLDEEVKLLEQLSEFELGRFLLMNKGLNGYWTAYIILHGPKKNNLHPLEEWILHHAPSVKATQERFRIFQKVLKEYLIDNITIASIPCGLMDDLLTLDYSSTNNVSLVGIDLDTKSLDLVEKNAQMLEVKNTQFFQKDAWRMDTQEEFDIITSNGLNIYESNDNKVTDLYKQFHKALKTNGILIVSFLTPPPTLSAESPWVNVYMKDVLKQKAVFGDIIGVAWQSFRTEAKTREQLEQAGFQILHIIYDSQGIFPTVVAKKTTIDNNI